MRQHMDVELPARGPKGAWTHILIPFDAAEVFGRRGLIRVAGTINGHPFRSSLKPEGQGRHCLAVNKEMLAGAGAAPGEVVHLVLEPDAAERTVEVPAELALALASAPKASSLYAGLSYSHRKEYAEWVGGAKKIETRKSRAQKALVMLVDGRRGRST